MKIMIVLALIVLSFFVVTRLMSKGAESNTEKYKYQVVKNYGDFELRKYEAASFSYVQLDSDEYSKTSTKGFRYLAGYIFGKNDRNEKIAMTSPVAMTMDEKISMMFMIPSKHEIEELPKPHNANIKFKKEPEKLVAAIPFGGWANDKRIQKYIEKLGSLLEEAGISHKGNFTYLGYNPPYELTNRKNEIIVELLAYQE